MPTITLDEIRASIERKYAPVVIELGGGKQCELRQAVRLPAEARAQLAKLQDVANEEGSDPDPEKVTESLREMIRIVASKPAEAKSLLAALGDDLAMLREILDVYMEASEPGEASPSPS